MNILVHKHNLEIAKAPVNEREINVSKIIFTFDEDLSNYTKEAYFTLNGNSYKVLLTNDECYIPSEALSEYGELEIGVVAFLVENDTEIKRYNPSPVYINTLVGSLKEAENSEPITPTDKEQMEQALNDGLDAIDNAISQVNTAIQETNNLNLDANKVGKEATITLTKKDGTQKIVKIEDGVSLQFMWQGTSLGIKTDDMDEYVFVNLQGIQGPMGPQGQPFQIKKTYPTIQAMVDDYDNMQVNDYVMISGSIEQQDNATLWVKTETQAPTYKWVYLADFSGASGIQGPPGPTPNIQIGSVTSGDTPSVTRSGTDENPIFDFVLQPGPQGQEGQTGPTGNGISNIEKTNETPSQSDYRINYTNGGYFDYSVLNGEVTKTQLEMLENALPHVSGTGTSITLNNTAKYNMPLELGATELSQEDTPTPTTPQNVHVISGDNSTVVSTGNLQGADELYQKMYAYNPNYVSKVKDGDINAIQFNSGMYRPKGTGFSFNCYDNWKENTQYTIRAKVKKIGGNQLYIQALYTDGTNSFSQIGGSTTNYTELKFVTTANKTIERVGFSFGTAEDWLIDMSSWFIGEGSVNEYPEYQGTQTKTLTLGDIEYCKIGNYSDHFFKAIDGDSIYDTLDSTTKASLTSGKWYLQKNIGKVVFDGSESWVKNATYSNVFYYDNATPNKANDTKMSNYFVNGGTASSSANVQVGEMYNWGSQYPSRIILGIEKDTLSDFTTWLSTHNPIIYYPISTPTYILLNDTLQTQLDDIYYTMLSYQGQTNVSQVNNDLPFEISSKALKDISNL